MEPRIAVWVAVGAALGGIVRLTLATRGDRSWPLGTLAANIIGCLVIGVAAGLGLSETGWALLATGFCGALTTWSSFAVQAYDQGPRRGSLLVALTLGSALAACLLGYAVGSSL